MSHPTELPLTSVRFPRGLLSERASLVRTVVIPYQWEALNDRVPDAERSGTVNNFQIAAGEKQGAFYGLWFQDSDLAKWIEAASFRLATHPDARLSAELDGIIATIAKAQESDGYLDTYIQLVEPQKKWANLFELHELYIAGHFIEAGVAHFEATGKRTLLDVVAKLADLIERTFGTKPGQIAGYCGHPEIELALLKLARAAQEPRYTQLAAYFVDQRGAEPNYFEGEFKRLGLAKLPEYFYHDRWAYLQADTPVRNLTEPVGHAVRMMYLGTAMADLARELGDDSLRRTCETLWSHLHRGHLYITGGVGADWMGEKFSEPYDLPNDRAYAESCAAIGLMFFARRMLDLELCAEYGDTMERALFNNVLAGMSHDGTKFFYVNPLELTPKLAKRRYDCRAVKTQRVGWFGCACCPPNIARLFASLGRYAYSTQTDGLAVHLYSDSTIETKFHGIVTKLAVHTDYPWSGDIKISVTPVTPVRFTLRLRIPQWCRSPRLSVGGAALDLAAITENGYASIDREWQAGDEVGLTLPMAIERVRAHPRVTQNSGCVALQRGPLVYCVEEIDNGAQLGALRLPREAASVALFDARLLGGAIVIETAAERLVPANDELYSTAEPVVEATTLRAIPYALWANRGEGEMRVWLQER
ncbi:MAG TPA: beta-L-arabinofuranosidase domain-containing protein [Opitutus sp.]|nr:beta-L-arabinofuranosidase domain-containing protein [Opitutus sp.]